MDSAKDDGGRILQAGRRIVALAKIQKEKILHLGIAAFFALLAGLAASAIFTNRDAIFSWDWQRPDGEFQTAVDDALFFSAQKFVDSHLKEKDQVCVSRWVGKDSGSVYLAVGCARFWEKMGEKFAEGDQNFIPARLRYKELEVTHLQRANPAELENSLRRIFPKIPGLAARISLNRDLYMKLGLEKFGAPAN